MSAWSGSLKADGDNEVRGKLDLRDRRKPTVQFIEKQRYEAHPSSKHNVTVGTIHRTHPQ